MENSFDNAHFSFVHQATFGMINAPKPKKYEIVETEYGFRATTVVDILNPPIAHQRNRQHRPELTERRMNNHWYLPFCRRLDMDLSERHPAHHHQLRHADRRRLHPTGAVALSQ